MARQALLDAGLPFDLVRSEDIRGGALRNHRMLFVPGGWASHKLGALGERGCAAIRRFVEAGGGYLGICGGAGMATEDGLALLPVRRKPSAQRVASFSGPVRLTLADHPIWRGIGQPVFHAWWPSQFGARDPDSRVLAAYEEALPGAFSSDVPVSEGIAAGWPELEARYGILLDPSRLRGEPAVLDGRLGRGRVVLSLIHFDTPADPNGAAVLRHLWDHLAPGWSAGGPAGGKAGPAPSPEILDAVEGILGATAELLAWGESRGLWRWRNPYLLLWRRGVRGLEYGTLAVMVREMARRLGPTATPGGAASAPGVRDDVLAIRDRILPFAEQAKALLERERRFMQAGALTPLRGADEETGRLRRELFGASMSHGGRFKPIIDAVDRILFRLLRSG
jgi:putative intracellular protease/amidase